MRAVNRGWIGIAIGCLGLLHPCSGQVEHRLKLDLGAFFDLDKAFALTPASAESMFSRDGFKENPFIHWEGGKAVAIFSEQPYSNVAVALSVLDGEVILTRAEIVFADGRVRRLGLVTAHADDAVLTKLRTKINAILECTAERGPTARVGWKSDLHNHTEVWQGKRGVALVTVGSDALAISLVPPSVSPDSLAPPLISLGKKGAMKLEFFLRLDEILAAPGLWSLTPEIFESSVNLPGPGPEESPFYKWNTAARDTVLLSRHVFGNTTADLLLFDDAVNAEEATIEFRGGKAGKVTVSLLTRGNSGEGVAAARFDAVFKATGRALSASLGVRPIRAVPAGKNLTKIEGYLWTTPHTLALLEYNAEAPRGQVEFLRLKLMPATGRSELLNLAGIGDNATTRSLSSFAANVKHDAATGDNFIAGVPMIDQGQKGYCVSASCARMFSYLGVPCDQNDMAELVKNDAERGTSPSVMYSALRKIDQQYHIRVKVMKLPRGFGLEGMTALEAERAQKGDLTKLVQENIGLGVPLLWAVQLPKEPAVMRGASPEGAIIVTDPQSGGGHMRLIIGYNTRTRDIIFTDSWGAGHEKKRMPLKDAEAMTRAVFSMQPAR